MAKGYAKRPPNFRPLVFWRALALREHEEKSDKSFTFIEEFARSGDHWRLRLVHSACRQGLRARAMDHRSRKTTRFSKYSQRHHWTHKAEYTSERLKDPGIALNNSRCPQGCGYEA